MSVIPIEQIFKYVNQARTNPKSFSKFVQQDIQSFVDNRRMPLMPNFYYSTNQGISAWKQCLSFLNNINPLYPYKMSQSMNLIAKDHASDMQQTGIQGHRGSDGSTLTDRIQRRCGDFDGGAWAQNIGSQFNIDGRNHALRTVLGLIIDDGVKSRGHRQNIFSDEYEYIGIYSVLQGDKIKTVMNFHSDDLQLADSDSEDNDDAINNSNNNHFQPQPNIFQRFNNNNQQKWNFQSNPQTNFGDKWNPQQNLNFQGGQQTQNLWHKRPKKSKKTKIGSSIRQSTEYVNGKMIVRTTQTIRFSDGSIQQHQTIQQK